MKFPSWVGKVRFITLEDEGGRRREEMYLVAVFSQSILFHLRSTNEVKLSLT